MKELLRKLSIMAGTYYINIHGTIRWSSNDRDVVTMSGNGMATGKGIGYTTILCLLPWMEATRARARQSW